MKLRRLEIAGFKSFRDRVTIEFPDGITAVVGPNGCGKSNIVDAVRWVMGEQRVRTLRGRKMEDVIFAGTQDCPPAGFAEVSMVLVAVDGFTFPDPYGSCAEVTVSRRLYRGGDSEYTINRVPCRLIDVREFFMGTGVGVRTYSLVEQSGIAELVEARPEERRQLIEEAAGISKYRSRREAAERKMEATKQNLQRINDVMKEVKSSLSSLSRQAKRAQQYRDLRKNIREGEVLLARHTYAALAGDRDEWEARRVAMDGEVGAAETALQRAEAHLETIRAELIETEGAKAGVQESLYGLKSRIHAKEQALEFSRTKIVDLRRRQERLVSEEENFRRRLVTIARETETITDGLGTADGEVSRLKEEVRRMEERSEELRRAEKGLHRDVEEGKRRYVDMVAERARLANTAQMMTKHVDDLKRRQERERRDGEERSRRLAELETRWKGLQEEIAADEEVLEDLLKRRKVALDEQVRLRMEIEERQEELAAVQGELDRKSARLLSLKEFHEGYAWCGDATRTLMKDHGDNRARVLGLVADCISVAPAYETAVEAVLGDKLQYVIVRSQEDGIEAIDYLKATAMGRSTFVPVELRRKPVGTPDAEHLKGAVRLLDYVTVEENFRTVAEYLLGDCLLISDLRTGLALWRRNGFRGTFVTPDGDTIGPQGILTGGSGGGNGRSLLKDKREIRELEEVVRSLTRSVKEITAEKKVLAEELSRWSDEAARVEAEIRRMELRLNGLRKDLERLNDECRRVQQTVATAEMNGERIEEEIKVLVLRKEEIENTLRLHEGREAGLDAELREMQAKWQVLRGELDVQERSLTEIRVRLATIEEKRRALEKERASLAAERSALTGKINGSADERRALDEEAARLEKEIEENRTALAEFYRLAEVREGELRELTVIIEGCQEKLLEADKGIKEAKALREAAVDRRRRAEVEVRELDLQMENLRQMILEKHGVDLAVLDGAISLLSGEGIEELRDRLFRERQTLDDFGEVNLLAIKEYEEKKERHDFLAAQAADLNSSLAALQRTIARINRVSRERFAETFAGVNQCFQEVFGRIFPGGKGELRLTDEGDLLETGVDIDIRIPGKRLQNITLLSGGEKSFAAIALIMAVILYKPSPFLILDEVDAALDDGNVTLFANLIKEMSNRSQVIMVTHNKRAMEAAETLYGVTMEKQGISTTVSVSLR